jgi:hypothetical protein
MDEPFMSAAMNLAELLNNVGLLAARAYARQCRRLVVLNCTRG